MDPRNIQSNIRHFLTLAPDNTPLTQFVSVKLYLQRLEVRRKALISNGYFTIVHHTAQLAALDYASDHERLKRTTTTIEPHSRLWSVLNGRCVSPFRTFLWFLLRAMRELGNSLTREMPSFPRPVVLIGSSSHAQELCIGSASTDDLTTMSQNIDWQNYTQARRFSTFQEILIMHSLHHCRFRCPSQYLENCEILHF